MSSGDLKQFFFFFKAMFFKAFQFRLFGFNNQYPFASGKKESSIF